MLREVQEGIEEWGRKANPNWREGGCPEKLLWGMEGQAEM